MLQRPVAAILLVTMIPQLSGCAVHTTRGVPLASLRPEERHWLDAGDSSVLRELRIAGVTALGGSPMMFDTMPAPWESQDSVFANVGGRPAAIPRSVIEEVWVVRRGNRPVSVGTSDLARALEAVFSPGPIAGLTSRTGERMMFDRRTPIYITRDTLHAAVRGHPYALALNDVERMWVVRTDPGLSVLASVGLVVGCLALAGAAVALTGGMHMGGGFSLR